MTVNQERIELWQEALRSGEYSQTVGVLHNDSGFCCLGVACEVARKNGLDLEVSQHDDGDWRYGGRGEMTTLPIEVVAWYGLPSGDPDVLIDHDDDEDEGSTVVGLIGLNDDDHWTFEAIADVLDDIWEP